MRIFTFMVVVFLLIACGSQPKKTHDPIAEVNTTTNLNIEQLLNQAQSASQPLKSQLLVQAFNMAIEVNQLETAAKIIMQLPLTMQSDADVMLTHAKWRYTIGQFARSVDILKQIQIKVTYDPNNSPLGLEIDQLLADNYLALGNLYESFSIRTQLNQRLNETEKRHNSNMIWKTLNAMSLNQIDHFATTTYQQSESAWLNLASISKQAYDDPTKFVDAIERWQLTYPLHQQQFVLPESIQRAIQAKPLMLNKVAIALPLSGPLRPSAEAVRDGFISAKLHSRSNVEVVVLNTMATDFREQLLSLSDQGVEFIVGPLTKESVASVARERLPIPMLALNQLEKTQPSPDLVAQQPPTQPEQQQQTIIQFGLPAEDDAEAMAKLTEKLNFKNALLLMPNSVRGKRVAEHYTQEVLKKQGLIVDVDYYSKVSEIEDKIESVLGVKSSKARHRQLKSVLDPELISTPRRRQDIDVILLSAPPSIAITIKPYLNLHYAHDLPVIADSTIYNGQQNVESNSDLNRVYFVDIPFAIEDSNEANEIKSQSPSTWLDNITDKGHLFALGYDSFKILKQLPLLQNFSDYKYPGLTGYLQLDEQGVIKRELPFAQFNQGIAKKIEFDQ